MGHVVAVADVGDPDPFKPSELLADGEEVGEGLARVVGVREPVYDGDLGGPGQLLEFLVVEGPDHDGVYVAGEDAPVSDGVSRLPICISWGSKWRAWPPSWYMPTSKETRVRFDGFWKTIASVLPRRGR